MQTPRNRSNSADESEIKAEIAAILDDERPKRVKKKRKVKRKVP
jgi:hypothetical protein